MSTTTRRLQIIIDQEGNAESRLGKLTSVLGGLGKVALGGIAVLGAGLAGAGAAGLSFNNSMEQATATINAFTKDSDKTAKILEMVEERAAKTPFAFDEMAKSAGGLIPVANQAGESLESLLQDAEVLAASNPAEGLEGAAFALREAVSGDFTSIIERFNLPRQYINQLKDEGVPALEIVRQAMAEMGYDTDLVSGLAETAMGRWSTFKDTLQSTAAIVTRPIFEAFSSGLGWVNGLLEANAPLIENFAQALGQRVAAGIEFVISGFQRLAPLGQMVMGMFAQLQAFFAQGFQGATINLLQMLGLSPEQITGLMNAANQVGVVINGMIQFVVNLLSLGGGNIQTTMLAWRTYLTGWITQAYANIPTYLNNLITSITAFLTGGGVTIRESVQGWIMQFWQWVDQAVAQAGQVLGALLVAIAAWAMSGEAQSNLNEAGIAIGQWIADGLAFMAANQALIAEIMLKLAGTILAGIAVITGILITVGSQIVAGIITGLLQAIGIDLRPATISQLGGILRGIGRNMMTIARTIGRNIVEGIRNGITSGAGMIASAARRAARSALRAARAALGISSPSKRFETEVGTASTAGFSRGLVKGIPQIQSSAKQMAQAALATTKNATGGGGSYADFIKGLPTVSKPKIGPPKAPPKIGPPKAPPKIGPPKAPPKIGPPPAPPKIGSPPAPPKMPPPTPTGPSTVNKVTINITYAPSVSMADKQEIETKFVPLLLAGLRKAGVQFSG